MARAAVKITGTAVVSWEAEMEAAAKVAAGMEASAGGTQRFSTRGGILAIDDAPVPGNHVAAVILDSILENAFYEGEWDAENPAPPTCFALGRDEATLAPHSSVVERGQAQHATCRGCPMNVFGTAERGRGKACKNRRRLMVIKAGELDAAGRFSETTEAEHFETAPPAMLGVPPTSVNGYAAFVKSVANAMKLPPFGIFTKISVRPDPKRQFVTTFEPLKKIPAALMPLMLRRNKEVAPAIEQPFNLDADEAPEPQAKGRAAAKKPAVKRGGKY